MKRREVIQNFIKKYQVRLVICGVLVTALYVTPALTQAQYKWTLNGYNILQAAEFYFDGNYMHDVDENAYYQTTGWDGTDLVLPEIEVRNYDNALLSNKKGEDVYYVMDWEIKTFNANGNQSDTPYRLEVENSEGNTAVINENTATGSIIGDGNPKKQGYRMMVKVPQSGKLGEGDYIEITLHAKNTDQDGGTAKSFQRELGCTFRYIVSTADAYIRNFNPQEKDKSREVSLMIGTGTIPGMDAQTQTVNVWWDMEYFEVNPFNMTFSEMSSHEGYYRTEVIDGKSYGVLKITGLGSNANRSLGFYKQNGYGGKTNIEIWGLTNTELIGSNSQPTDGKLFGYYLDSVNNKGTQQ